MERLVERSISDLRERIGRTPRWEQTGPETRVLWGLAVGAAAEMIGVSVDEFVAMARAAAKATRPLKEVRDDGER